mmetsp:Transcript_21861/g.39009  ORF Transcript_21861/g.39009 Transcript_21861/m.39009 type:complete len:577 (+) Transcript_21861:74-1804(+)
MNSFQVVIFVFLTICFFSLSTAVRNDAFIGYSEESKICKDLAQDCRQRAANKQCLFKPFEIRPICPRTCGVESCVYPGTKAVFSGSVSSSGTKSYIKQVSRARDAAYREFDFGDGPVQLSTVAAGSFWEVDGKGNYSTVVSGIIGAVQANGINIIDTDVAFNDGVSELATGEALAAILSGKDSELFSQEKQYQQDVMRNMFLLTATVGPVDEEIINPLLKSGELSESDIAPTRSYCLKPACIRASVARSRERLRVSTIDVVLLRHPIEEIFSLGSHELELRLLEAFTELELLRLEGTIRAYGIKSYHSLRLSPDHHRSVMLQSIVPLASKAFVTASATKAQAKKESDEKEHTKGIKDETAPSVKKHGFRFLYVPINALMPEAWLKAWQAREAGELENKENDKNLAPLTQVAQSLGIAVVATAPLTQTRKLPNAHKAKKIGSIDPKTDLFSLEGLDRHPLFAPPVFIRRPPRLLQFSRSLPHVLSASVGVADPSTSLAATVVLKLNDPLTDSQIRNVFSELVQGKYNVAGKGEKDQSAGGNEIKSNVLDSNNNNNSNRSSSDSVHKDGIVDQVNNSV